MFPVDSNHQFQFRLSHTTSNMRHLRKHKIIGVEREAVLRLPAHLLTCDPMDFFKCGNDTPLKIPTPSDVPASKPHLGAYLKVCKYLFLDCMLFLLSRKIELK